MQAVTGILEVETNRKIQNELVFVEAFNGEIWGGADNYLVDFSWEPPVNEEIQKIVQEISGRLSKEEKNSNSTKQEKKFYGNAVVKELSERGILKIAFNESIDSESYLAAHMENQTILLQYEVADEWNLDETYNASKHNFTWKVITFTPFELTIQINFNHPIWVSALNEPD